MADSKLLKRLKRGVGGWNAWRNMNRGVYLDLSGADLHSANLSNAKLGGVTPFDAHQFDANNAHMMSDVNLSDANLSNANLSGADLYAADLNNINLSSANLSYANLKGANLSMADLNSANLSGADLYAANLHGAHLGHADLRAANLCKAYLREACLRHARLNDANLSGTNLNNSDLREARASNTIFAQIDLREVKGLAELQHASSSRVELHTIQLPQDGSALHFLRGAGIPDEWIDLYLVQMMHPIQYHSCFISYSSKDEMFAHHLHAYLQDRGVRCWFAPHDMKTGDKVRPVIDQMIHQQDKLLLILSEHSVASDWVEHEVETALARERKEKRIILFPIRLDNAILEREYTGWAALVQNERHIGDFTHWTNPRAYEQAFERLLRDLKKADEQTYEGRRH